MIWLVAAACLLLFFGAVVFRGAPYVPTHARTVHAALDLLNLPAGSTIVDLGSGDGVLLKAAAARGLHAIGYEINPFLCLIAWLRCLRFSGRVRIYWRDFWLTKLPPQTNAVFIFLAGPYMRRFGRKILRDAADRTKPLLVVSNGFAIPGLKPTQVASGLYVYEIR